MSRRWLGLLWIVWAQIAPAVANCPAMESRPAISIGSSEAGPTLTGATSGASDLGVKAAEESGQTDDFFRRVSAVPRRALPLAKRTGLTVARREVQQPLLHTSRPSSERAPPRS